MTGHKIEQDISEFQPDQERSSGKWVDIKVNGKTIRALHGQPLAAALIAAGFRTMRHTQHSHSPRGMFCGMGVCYECLVRIRGQGILRSCMTEVVPGLEVEIEEVRNL